MRSIDEIIEQIAILQHRIEGARQLRRTPGVADAMRSSAAIEASLAAAQLCALAWALGEIASPASRSKRLPAPW